MTLNDYADEVGVPPVVPGTQEVKREPCKKNREERDIMTLDEVAVILDRIHFKLDSVYAFGVSSCDRGMFISARYIEQDIHTGALESQFTRRWFVSHQATESEIVQTCLKCALTSAEHRVREAFTYKGRRCFGPPL